MLLNNLAAALQTRYNQGGKQHDLDECIFFHRQAFEHHPPPHSPPPHSTQSIALNNLQMHYWPDTSKEVSSMI